MADQYPYSMNYKPKPVDAFLSAFAASMEKLLMYKYQQTLQDDSAAKRLTMEREFEAQRQAQTEAALSRTPEYQRKQQDLAAFSALSSEKQQVAREIDWGLRAKPKEKDKWDLYLESLIPGAKTGDAAAAPVDPDIANMTARHVVAGKIGEPAAKAQFPPSEQETMWGVADAERKTVEEDIKAQALETNKAARERERDINLLMTSGRVKSRAEAEKVLADTDAAKRLGDKPEAAPSEMKLFIDGYREENPLATKADVFAAYKQQKRGDVQAELEMRDALMKDRWYPTAFLDEKTGLPLVGDREGNVRPAGVMGGVVPTAKPTEADKKTASEINNIQEGIKRIRDNYDSGFVGPIAGRYGGAKESTIGIPATQAEFYADVRSMKDALLRAKSGAQINEQEYRRLVKFLPDENSPSGVFEARLNRFERELNSIITGRTKARRGAYPAPTTNPPPPDLRGMFGVTPQSPSPQSIDIDTEIDSYLGR